MGPTYKKKDKSKNKMEKLSECMKGDGREEEVLIFFILFILSQIHENLTVGFRRDKHEKCSMRRGLRVGTRNTGFHQEFR